MFDWITRIVETIGAFGVAALMFIENLFPPIPSELIMPLAGFSASQSQGAPWLVLIAMIAAGSLGSLAGAVLWYWIGQRIGVERLKSFSRNYGRWLTLTPGDIDKADVWFDRYGPMAVFAGRLIPTVRTFISVPAGMSGMAPGKFLIYSAAGTVIWTALLGMAGWFLGSRYDQVSTWLNPVSSAVLVLILGWYLYRVATFRRKLRHEDESRGNAGN